MKKILIIIILYSLFAMSWILQAQSITSVSCGDTLSGQLVEGALSQSYSVDIETGTILVVHSDPLPISASLGLSLEILNANGSIVGSNDYAPDEYTATIETSTILATGTYQINVSGDDVGDYQLFISCVDMNGDVISNNNLIQPLACGEQIDNIMIRPDELHRYYLYLEDGMVMDVFLEALYGSFAEMTFELGLYSPANQELNGISDAFKDIELRIFEQNITSSGVYRLYVRGFDGVDENYRISVDCILANGDLAISDSFNRRVLESTLLTVSDTIDDMPSSDNDTSVAVTQLDLIEDIPNTGQLRGNEPAIAYTFSGDADDVITVNYVRIRGEGNIDVELQAPDGEIIFASSLLLADGLSMAVRLLQSGEYQLVVALSDRSQDSENVFTIEVGWDD